MKEIDTQLNIQTYKSSKVSATNMTISYAHCQNLLLCAGAEIFGMRNGENFWYAQAQVNLVCAGAGQFGMHRRRLI